MKKKFLLPGLLLVIIIFVILIDVTAGGKHVEVVQDNTLLVNENGKLKNENTHLKSENSKLIQLTNKLTADLTNITNSIKSVSTVKAPQNELSEIIVKIENEVQEDLGWCSPEGAYALLTDKLGKTPTKNIYKQTLKSLIKKNMLYYPGNPDPYMKGNKIKESEVDNLVN